MRDTAGGKSIMVTDSDPKRNEAIIAHARQALTAISSDLVFEPGAAATSLALALGYLVGAFGLDADSVFDVIHSIAEDTKRECHCPHCRVREVDWLRESAFKQ